MNLTHIKYFLALARELHFWNTAEKVFITQSALSRHIMALEDELGFPLFERNKRNVQLTESGKVMQKEWEILMLQIENVHHYARQVHEGEEGNLRIGHPGSITHSVLPDLTKQFIGQYPKLKIEFIEMMTVDLEKALLNFQVDIGFRREVSANYLLETRNLFEESFAIFVPAHHKIKSDFVKNLKGFEQENFILPDFTSDSLYIKTLKKIFNDSGFEPKMTLNSEFGSTILSLINQNLGISILPISYARSSPPNIRAIKIPYHSALFAQWRKDDLNPILRNFVKIFENYDYKSRLEI